MRRLLPIAAIVVAAAYPGIAARAMPGHATSTAGRIGQVVLGSSHHVSLQLFKHDAHGVHRVARIRDTGTLSGNAIVHLINRNRATRGVQNHLAAHLSGADLAVTSVDSVPAASQSSPGANAGPFQYFHSAYSGFQSASAAEWDGSSVTFWYQGTVFDNATSAFAYADVGYEQVATSANTNTVDCTDSGFSNLSQPFCRMVGYPASGLDQQGYYAVASIDQCTVEAGFQGDNAYINNYWSGVSTFWGDLFTAGLDKALQACAGVNVGAQPTNTPLPQPTLRPTLPPPPTANLATNTPGPIATNTPTATPTATIASVHFSIDKVRWEKRASSADANAKALKSAKPKTKTQVAVYFHVDSAPDNAPVTIEVQITHSGKEVAHGLDGGQLDAPAAGNYAAALNWKLPSKTGKYKATVVVSVGSASEKKSATIKDKK